MKPRRHLKQSKMKGRGSVSDKIIRNRSSVEVGYIKTDARGKQTAYNSQNKLLGCYDPKSNFKKDTKGRILGNGNMLTQLILLAG